VLAVQAGAGQDDADVGGGALSAVNGRGPPVLGVAGQVGGWEGDVAAAAQVAHDEPACIVGGQNSEPVTVAQRLGSDRDLGVVLLREEHVTGPPRPLLDLAAGRC